ncbi:MAG: tetratricopeptide repeat protein [Lachnospiraceae bacterium]|nr:tetratricopeptide repeat protein [Lachnospiraceae bacterium]
MDKYEYKLRLDELKSLVAEQKYERAAELCDELNWKKVKNVNSLVQAGEAYEKVGRYEDAREVLLDAYDRSPIGRMIIYRLAELAIKVKNFDEAKEYYDEFIDVAPHDNLRYVLRYEMMKAEGVPLAERIALLEEFKEEEYTEKWAFELAYLYHRAGDSAKCVDACDELVLWFGDGPYVEKALELKMLYQPLNKIQEQKYRDFRMKKTGQVEVHTGEKLHSGEIIAETIRIPDVSLNTEKYNTVNLQAEIAKSMEQIANAREKDQVSDSMDIIKGIVEEIPYLQIEDEKPEEEEAHIETDEEIDSDLSSDFERYLAEERDGQMSLMIPEERVGMPQITGQLSIDEVLAEWEKTRRAAEAAMQDNEERRLESEKQRALKEAREIMEKLSVVIPQLEAGMTPKEILEDKYASDIKNDQVREEEKQATRLVEDVNTILQKEIDRLNRDLNPQTEEVSLPGDKDIKELKAPEEPEVELPKLELPEVDFSMSELLHEERPNTELPKTESPKAEPITMELPKIELPKDESPKAEPITMELPKIELPKDEAKEPVREAGIVAESPEKWIPRKVTEIRAPESSEKTVKPFEPVKIKKEETEKPEALLEQKTVPLPEIVMPESLFDTTELPTKHMADKKEELPKPESKPERVPEEPVRRAPEAVKKAPEPINRAPGELKRPEPTETAPKNGKIPEKPVEKKALERPAPVKKPIEKAPTPAPGISKRPTPSKPKELNGEERQLFSYFLDVEGMEDQIRNTVSHISDQYQQGGRFGGHVLIQGVSGNGKTTLAKDIVKAVKSRTGRKFGNVASIEAAALNRKDMEKLFEKVNGGALLIEGAGYLSAKTASKLAASMKADTSGTMVILEGTKDGLNGIMSQSPELASHFLERIVIPAFTSDELVRFAKAYANEEEYEIDEMAVLALYDRISKIRKLDEVTTLTEVKEIVDKAIDKAERISVRNLFGGRRSDENGYVLLQEKDFV